MKKICILLDQFIMGGVEKVAVVLFPQLTQKYNVSILLKTDSIEPFFEKILREKGITIYYPPRKPKGLFKRKYYKWFQKRKYNQICQKMLTQSDLILDYKNFSSVQEIKKYQVPKIGFIHGSFAFFEKYHLIDKAKVYDQIICLSHNFKKDFIKKYPESKNKITVIYNPIDSDEIRKHISKEVFSKNKYFVAVQRLDKLEKDVATIIKAFNLFCQKNSDVFLYIVGDGPHKEEFQNLAKGNDRIIFTGQINNIYATIKSAEALILSSWKNFGEGLPNVLLEAQALGTLAISSDVPSGPSEILMDGQAGILFPPSNAEKLAQIMSDVIDHKINKPKMIETARKNLKRFNHVTIVSQILDLIEKTMEKK